MYIGLDVTGEYLRSQLGKPLRSSRATKVGATDAIPQSKQHLGNPAHADATNPHKMNALNLCEHTFIVRQANDDG
jgi:hypothetical protein